jgi:hypothetical protein
MSYTKKQIKDALIKIKLQGNAGEILELLLDEADSWERHGEGYFDAGLGKEIRSSIEYYRDHEERSAYEIIEEILDDLDGIQARMPGMLDSFRVVIVEGERDL